MATGPRIETEGLKELRAALRGLGSDQAVSLKSASRKAAEIVATDARTKVPVRSGALLASIRGAGQEAFAVVRAGKGSVPYAGPIHFGWRRHNIKPQPFLYDAIDARRDEVIDTYMRELDDLMKNKGLK